MKSARFHMKYTAYLAFSGRPWNLLDSTTMKSARFHEIHTMKSTRFHMKYTTYLAFSGSGRGILGVPWNLLDSTMISTRFHMKYTAYLAFSGRPFHMKYTEYLAFSGRPWNLLDSTTMKSARFHEIYTMKSTRFHVHEICWIPLPWNPLDSIMKSSRFHMKYTAYLAFSGRPWNLPDFTWNTLHI